MIPSRLGIMHPTGYPLYSLMKAFTTIPIGSVAWRANLLRRWPRRRRSG